ncbi:MAG: spike base protein, RCAP_Rcc01079 family [Steroidobacteraceae bacterium]
MTAPDRFPGAEDLFSPACHAAAVTPSDTASLTYVSKRLWVGGAGNVTLITAGGQTVEYANVPAGTYLQVRAVQVNATGTTATAIITEY